MKINGISKYSIFRIDISEGKVEADSVMISEKTYDKYIRIYIDADFFNDFSKREVLLDIEGNIISQTIYNKSGEISSNLIYEYESADRIKTKKYYFGKTLTFYETYDYEQNLPSRIVVKNPDGEVINKTLFEHDNRGNIYKEIKYDNAKTIEFIYEYAYDNKGNCINEKLLLGGNAAVSMTESNYDSDNRLIEKRVYSKDKVLITKEIYGYFENGNLKSLRKTGSEDILLINKSNSQNNDLIKQCRIIDMDSNEEYILNYNYKFE